MKATAYFLSLIFGLCLSQTAFSQYTESEWEERDTWMPLEIIYLASGVKKGDKVGDIGCHEGYLTVRLAKKVGNQGKVYAEDIREDRLELLQGHLIPRHLTNVETILGDYDDPHLPDNTLDIIYLIDTYHEIDAHETMLEHIYKDLKPGGKVVILEKLKTRVKGKSRASMAMAHSMSPKYVKEELEASGFEIVYQNDDMGHWEEDEDKTIWMVIGQKPL